MTNRKESDQFNISNEFTNVSIKKVYYKNGNRLEIYAHIFEKKILLDSITLEYIARAGQEIIDRLIREYANEENSGDFESYK